MKNSIKNFLAMGLTDINFLEALKTLTLDQGVRIAISNGCVDLLNCTEDVMLRPDEIRVLNHVNLYIEWVNNETQRKAEVLRNVLSDIEEWDEEERVLLEEHYKEKYCNTKS